MGVTHLKTLLEKYATGGIKTYADMAEFARAKRRELGLGPRDKIIVAVDVSMYMIRYERNGKLLELFLRQWLMALLDGVILLYVFDGIAPQQKRSIIKDRQQKKQRVRSRLEQMASTSFVKGTQGTDPNNNTCDLSSYSVDSLLEHIDRTMSETFSRPCETFSKPGKGSPSSNYEEFMTPAKRAEFVRLGKRLASISNSSTDKLKKFFDLLRVPYITALEEADGLMVSLWQQGLVHALQTEDSDVWVMNCGSVIHVSNKGVKHFCLPRMLESLGLTYEQFVDLCVLLGSDYYKAYLPKMKWHELYNLYISLNDPCIAEFLMVYATIDSNIINHIDDYTKARDLFLAPIPKIVTHIDVNLCPISVDTITRYFNSNGIKLDDREIKRLCSTLGKANAFIKRLNPTAV